MRWTRFYCVVGAVLFFQQTCLGASDDDIVFAPKNFWDSGRIMEGVVAISGTLTGDGIAYKNNTYSIACYQERKECFVTSIEQIGPGQIGRIESPAIYPITVWNANEVVAAEEASMFGCSKVTITIVRKSESAFWVQEPTNQTRPECIKSDTKTYKWTIEDSLGWKKMQNR